MELLPLLSEHNGNLLALTKDFEINASIIAFGVGDELPYILLLLLIKFISRPIPWRAHMIKIKTGQLNILFSRQDSLNIVLLGFPKIQEPESAYVFHTHTRLQLLQCWLFFFPGGPPFLQESFDRILLDAPCSGMGQRPNMAYSWSLKEVTSYQPLQRKLFKVVCDNDKKNSLRSAENL